MGPAGGWASYLTFTVSGRRFALAISDVEEVLHLPELVRVPDGPSLLEGFLRVERHVVPVVALDRLFDLEPFERERYTPVILTGSLSEDAIGLLAEQTHGIVRIQWGGVEPLAETSVFNESVVGILSSDDGQAGILSLERLLLQRERATVEDFRQRERRRLEELGHAVATDASA